MILPPVRQGIGETRMKKAKRKFIRIEVLVVRPEYQRQGIGHKLLEFFKEQNKDWKKIELVTPADKEKNINFYTKKCGFKIVSEELDRKIRVFHFSLDKE